MQCRIRATSPANRFSCFLLSGDGAIGALLENMPQLAHLVRSMEAIVTLLGSRQHLGDSRGNSERRILDDYLEVQSFRSGTWSTPWPNWTRPQAVGEGYLKGEEMNKAG